MFLGFCYKPGTLLNVGERELWYFPENKETKIVT